MLRSAPMTTAVVFLAVAAAAAASVQSPAAPGTNGPTGSGNSQVTLQPASVEGGLGPNVAGGLTDVEREYVT